jgi:polyisoprenoid-binding protein YceI
LDRLSSGSVASVVARGTLRIHDVDRRVEFPIQVQLSGGRFQVVGRLRTKMTTFGFDPPSVIGLTTVRNGVTVEVNLTLGRSG